MRFMPITIELSFVDDPLEPIASGFGDYVAPSGSGATPANYFTNANTSATWQIQNVQPYST